MELFYNISTSLGDIAQLVEHTAHIRAVIGPSPIVPIFCRELQIIEVLFFCPIDFYFPVRNCTDVVR